MAEDASVGAMWTEFVATCPEVVSAGDTYSAWHFCDNEPDADELASLTRSGRKRATAGLLCSYEAEDEPLPGKGDFSVITYWDGTAACVIRTTSVDIVPFDAVTEEFAAIEGEGDGSLGYWREAHRAAFTRELSAVDRTFNPGLLVVCECFEVVFGGEAPSARRPGSATRQ